MKTKTKPLKLPFGLGADRKIFKRKKGDMNLRLSADLEHQSVVGQVSFSSACEGPPSHTHGGALAYVCDEAMGSVAWYRGFRVVAEKIEVSYHKPVRLNRRYRIEATFVRAGRKKIQVEARILGARSQIHVRSRGLFHILSPEQLNGLGTKKYK